MMRWIKYWTVTCCFLGTALGTSLPAWSAHIYVSPGGVGDGSIGNPTDLQTALDTARTNGSADTVYLQEGIYDASSAGAATFEYGSVSNDGMQVKLSGSWDATFTTQKTTGEPSTTLDGGGDSRVLDIYANAVSFDFAIEYLNLDNGYLVAGSGNGAGLRVLNENGGVINLYILHVGFGNNATQITGGDASGAGMWANCYFEMRECYLSGNHGYSAGAMTITSTDQSVAPIIDDCTFENNVAGDASHPGLFSDINFSNSPIITNSTFIADSTATWTGSSIHSYGGYDPPNTLIVDGCSFSGYNVAYWGGAIDIWDYNATITNSLFYNNAAGNVGDGRGGAITIYDPNPGTQNVVSIDNCTFYNNSGNAGASPGGAIYNRVVPTVTITNSIFWNNANTEIYAESGGVTVSYSDIDGGLTGTQATDGGGNINSDPLFANTTGDPSTWDFQLTAGSPAMEIGDNSVLANPVPLADLNGNARLWDGDADTVHTVDMGAYEFNAPGTMIIQVTPTSDSNCFDYACDLQTALYGAANAGRVNTELRLAQGTYPGNFTYFPTAVTSGDLAILGGWKNDFSSRTVDPTNTILDGGSAGRTLTLNNVPNRAIGSLKVEGLTLTQGFSALNTTGGGLLAMTVPPGGIDIQYNLIRFNTASRSGGGMAITSYDTASQSGGAINIANNIIYTNDAGQGTTLGTSAGGGMFVASGGTVTVTNNLIYDNAVGNLGAVPPAEGRGGGIFFSAYDGNVYLINNTMVNNGAENEAGGVYATEATEAWDVMNFYVYNNIIGGDPACKLFDCKEDLLNDISNTFPATGSTLTVEYNNLVVTSSSGAVTPAETNNITGDPLFVNETVGQEDYHLRRGSICIDTGTNAAPNMPSTDLDGQPRPQDGDGDGTATANMGCYEKLGGLFNWTMFLPGIIGGGK